LASTKRWIFEKPPIPAAASVLIGPCGDAVDPNPFRAEHDARYRTFASRLALARPITL
jgi:hypothetical protein